MKRTSEQKKAINPNINAWVLASAGSGKTSVLIDRILRILLTGTPPSKILCLTFTKAAAFEMSERLFSEVKNWVTLDDSKLKERLSNLHEEKLDRSVMIFARCLFAKLLESSDGIKIQTIHSFCESLLRKYHFDINLGKNFKVLDEKESTNLLRYARNKIFLDTNLDKKIREHLKNIITVVDEKQFDLLLADFLRKKYIINRSFRRYKGLDNFVNAIFNLLNVSIKDDARSVIKNACLDSDFEKENLLWAATKLMQGSKNDKTKGQKILEWINNKNSRFQNWDSYLNLYLSNKKNILKKLATNKVIADYPYIKDILSTEAIRILEVNKKCNNIFQANISKSFLLIFNQIINEYINEKKISNSVDYSDLISFTLNLLGDKSASSWALYKVNESVDHVLIDEGQDTSPDQWDVVYSITSEFFSGESSRDSNRTLFVVGDQKQSIYGFQGSDVEYFELMKEKYSVQIKASNKILEQISLSKSFRNSSVILNFVDTVFCNVLKFNQYLNNTDWIKHETARDGKSGIVEIWPLEESRKNDRINWELPIKYTIKPTAELKLARRISKQIEVLIKSNEILASKSRPITAGDIMILVRTRGSLFNDIILALKHLQIPVEGADMVVLTDQIVIKDLLALAEFVLLPEDDLNLASLLKTPFFGLDDSEIFELSFNRSKKSIWKMLKIKSFESKKYKNILKTMRWYISLSKNSTPFEFFSKVLYEKEKIKIISRLGYETSEVIDEFINKTLIFENDNIPSLQGFVAWFKIKGNILKRDQNKKNNKVKVMTVHAAKGLEAPVVFLPDTTSLPKKTEKLFLTENIDAPLYIYSSGKEKNKNLKDRIIYDRSTQEYLKLFYVAVTRAEDRLYICGCKNRENIAPECWYSISLEAFKYQESMKQSFKTKICNNNTKIMQFSEYIK